MPLGLASTAAGLSLTARARRMRRAPPLPPVLATELGEPLVTELGERLAAEPPP
ncbi:MAG: hypothetical protein N2038_10420 [Geminicoccaceae bacterium]|nr:hypothetical protein [Geminicoccaceae bacterium]MCS7267603.1 hypothetical protein [Geminicoccaceae bacterium]MCX7630653.1 hypothetical protein [Geminicoccaceae bacterium]MDW8123161.1 hypothetical protein [Geminicoccaceae bacterium]MDW8340179.1 hypothetical protein [Geminicoccaceae bacterium]